MQAGNDAALRETVMTERGREDGGSYCCDHFPFNFDQRILENVLEACLMQDALSLATIVLIQLFKRRFKFLPIDLCQILR